MDDGGGLPGLIPVTKQKELVVHFVIVDLNELSSWDHDFLELFRVLVPDRLQVEVNDRIVILDALKHLLLFYGTYGINDGIHNAASSIKKDELLLRGIISRQLEQSLEMTWILILEDKLYPHVTLEKLVDGDFHFLLATVVSESDGFISPIALVLPHHSKSFSALLKYSDIESRLRLKFIERSILDTECDYECLVEVLRSNIFCAKDQILLPCLVDRELVRRLDQEKVKLDVQEHAQDALVCELGVVDLGVDDREKGIASLIDSEDWPKELV